LVRSESKPYKCIRPSSVANAILCMLLLIANAVIG
jgi:hypothetical protein